MTEGRLEVESKSQECLVIIKREVTSNNLPKRRVLSSTHGVVGGRRLVTASYPIYCTVWQIPVDKADFWVYNLSGTCVLRTAGMHHEPDDDAGMHV